MTKNEKKINPYFFLFKKKHGENKIDIIIILKEKKPIIGSICKTSKFQEKLQLHKFHGNPERILFLKKSEIANKKLIRKIEDISF